MKIAIVDDLESDRQALINLLTEYMKHYDFTTEYYIFESGEEFVKTLAPDTYDLCFMDIYMKDLNGVETATRLREIDPSCFVIFLTTSPEFFSDGFRLRAWRYLLKPVTMHQLREALPECIEQILLSTRRLTVTIERREITVPFSHIYYVVTANRSIEIHGRDMVLTTGKQITFQELTAPLLKDYRFILIGKGQIVNLDYVKMIDANTLVLNNGDRLPISRSKISEVTETFVRFRFDKH